MKPVFAAALLFATAAHAAPVSDQNTALDRAKEKIFAEQWTEVEFGCLGFKGVGADYTFEVYELQGGPCGDEPAPAAPIMVLHVDPATGAVTKR